MYYIVVNFPLQKMKKMSWNSYSEHLEKITESVQNPENASEQSWENYRIWPKTFRPCRSVPVANCYISARVLLIFWLFWHQFGPKLKPNHWPNFHLILIEELDLENLSFGGWVLPKNPSSLHSLHPLLFTSHPISSIFHLPSSIHASIKFLFALGVDGKWLELWFFKGESQFLSFLFIFLIA